MEILKYFTRFKKDDIHVYELINGKHSEFINELTETFRDSYIDYDELDNFAKINEISKSDYLERFVIPDQGNIKSGDFGEMLSFHAVLENFKNKGHHLFGPYKWRWKDRNKASQ